MSIQQPHHWEVLADQLVVAKIGSFVKHHRLKQNKSQSFIATAAGLSRSTVSLLERGETVTVATLIQVLRVLNQLSVLEAFIVEPTISPLALAKLQQAERKRARRNPGKIQQKDKNSE